MENRTLKILAIDDNQDNLITIQALVLEAFPSAIVLTALTGSGGLLLAAKEDPDVILLDIIMPEMDGFEVCQRLKSNKGLSNIPVVFVTALKGDKVSRIKGLDVGAEAFLAKPIDESELIAQIRAMVKIKKANVERRDENERLLALVEERTSELKKTHLATLNLLEDLKKENEVRKLTEEALHKSEELYRSVINASPDNITVTDLEGKILMVSPKGLELLSCEDEFFIYGHKLSEFIIPEDRERALNNINHMLMDIFKGPEEYGIINLNGIRIDTEINAEFVRDINGNPVSIVFAIRDITDRKLSEKALRESEEKFRDMANLLPQVVFELDLEGTITYVNQQTFNIFGYDFNELIGKNSLMVHIPEDRTRVVDNLKLKYTASIEDREYAMLRKDGSTFPALIYTNVIYKEGQPTGIRGIVINITEQKTAEEKLSHAARLYSLLSQINQAIVRTECLDELFQTICQVAIQYGRFRMAWIGLPYDDDDIVKPVAFAGFEDGYLNEISVIRELGVKSKGPVSTAYRDGNVITSSDISTDVNMLLWRDEAIKRGYKSMASVPLKRRDKILATLNLYASEKDFFSIQELKLLQEIGEDISFAINALENEKERKETEIALENSRIELKTIYDYAPVMMCLVDEDRNILFANKAFNLLTNSEEVKNDIRKVGNLFQCVNSSMDDKGCGFSDACLNCSLRIAMDDTFKTGIGHYNIDYHSNMELDSGLKDISLLGSTAAIQSEGKNNILLCLSDISDRKLAEDALQKSEMLLRTFIDNTPFEIWARDVNDIGILENKKFVENNGTIIGYTPATDPRINKEMAQIWEKNSYRVFDGEIIDEEHNLIVNDELRIYEQIVFPISLNSKTIGIAGFNIDITDRKLADKKLLESEQRYRFLLETAMEGILVAQDDYLKFANHMISEISGFTEIELMSRPFLEFVYPNDRKKVAENYGKRLNYGEIEQRYQFRVLAKSGGFRWVEMSGNRIDWDGKPASINFLTDVTDRRHNEQALRNSQEQLKKFAAHLQNIREEERVLLAREIHDELGQILIAVKIDLGILKQNVLKGIDSERADNLLVKFNELSGLVDNTIHTARKIMTDLRPEVLDLLGFTEAVKQYLKTFEDRYKILCNFENNTKELTLNSQQSVALFRIIQEALNNVIKHSKATDVKIKISHNEDKLTLEIRDNGVGFDEKQKKNPDSYGLIGMQERVFLLEGELVIIGNKNRGTTIRIIMPYNCS